MPWRFFARLAVVYVVVVVVMVLAISPYFSNGWDPQIFAGVGRAVLDNNDVFDMYEVSRAAWGDWGFPYPPLYPHLLAPLIGLTMLAPALPDWLAVRAVPIIFDLTLSVLLYLLVMRRSRNAALARLGAALWLFNPLTLYQTAIQAHQECTWLVCVVAAYALLETRCAAPLAPQVWGESRSPARAAREWLSANLALPSLLMAMAVAFKQSAILFYIPYVVYLLLDHERRWTRLGVAGALFALVLGGLSLPYYIHSPDFFYLAYTDVSNMPVQTQSAVVWLLGLSSYLVDQTRSTFFLLKQQSTITMALAAVMSFFALRRDRDMVRVGLLTALLFFLTSKKVMGYHYVLLMPFLLLYTLPARRFDLLAIGALAASWIIVSPYYAPWAQPERLPLYAAIGTPNTILWLFMFVHVWRRDAAIRIGALDLTTRLRDGGAAIVALTVVTLGMILSSLAQPLAAQADSILHAFGFAGGGLVVFLVAGLLVVVILASLLAAVPVAWRMWAWSPRRPGASHVVLAVALIPVYFAAFALTQESTRIIETFFGAPVP